MNKKLILISVLFIGLAFATCDPPNFGGDWTILVTENCGNHSIELNITGDIIVNGNLSLNNSLIWINDDLNIYGNFSIDNSTIRMNGTTDGGSQIEVFAGGKFDSTNTSQITNGVTANAEFDFYFRDGSNGLINNTIISELYTNSNGILIADSSGNVAIENSSISNSEGDGIYLDSGSSGIRIYNVTINTIDDDGIFLGDSSNNEIIYNNISDVGLGPTGNCIYITGTSNLNEITDNTLYNSGVTGITIRQTANNNTIENNNISQCTLGGIWLTGTAGDNNITNNNISGNPAEGVYIDGSASYNNIVNNTFTENIDANIYIEDVSTTWIYGNNITNSTIGSNTEGIHIRRSRSIVIDNNAINLETNDAGIRLQDSTDSIVSNNTIINTQEGISMINTNSSSILNNSITNSTSQGIEVYYLSENNTIDNNTITISPYGGIYFYATGGSPNRNNVTNNTVYNTTEGIYLESSTNTFIFGNNITLNNVSGINSNQSTGTIIDSNIIQNNTVGLILSWYSSYSDISDVIGNNTMTNNNITLSFNNTNCTVHNVTMPTAVNWNATLSHNSQVTFENVTFDSTTITVSDTSLLSVKWYVDVTTQDNLGVALGSVIVTSRDAFNNAAFQGTSSLGGFITLAGTEYIENSATKTYYQPYIIIGKKSEYDDDTESIELYSNNATTLQLELSTGGIGGNSGNGVVPPDDEEVENISISKENMTVEQLVEEFKKWMDRYNITDPWGDPDNDGCNNFCEFFNDCDPYNPECPTTEQMQEYISEGGGGGIEATVIEIIEADNFIVTPIFFDIDLGEIPRPYIVFGGGGCFERFVEELTGYDMELKIYLEDESLAKYIKIDYNGVPFVGTGVFYLEGKEKASVKVCLTDLPEGVQFDTHLIFEGKGLVKKMVISVMLPIIPAILASPWGIILGIIIIISIIGIIIWYLRRKSKKRNKTSRISIEY